MSRLVVFACNLLVVLAVCLACNAPAAQPNAAQAAAAPPPPPAPSPAPAQPTEFELAAAAIANPQTRGEALLSWKATAQDLDYAMLERNADSQTGRRIYIRAKVLEVHDRNGGSVLRIATRGSYDKPLWVETLLPAGQGVVARSTVTVVGVLAGNYSYTSQAGWNITIPQALGVAVLLESDASAAVRDAQRAARQ